MKVRNATPQELIDEGLLTVEEAEQIEQYAQYIDEHNALPPAEKVVIREVGRPKSFGEDLEFVGVRMPRTQRAFIDAYARASGHSRSDVLREAIDLLRNTRGDLINA